MRHWLFHPLLFYPLAIALAALVIIISIQPQALPRDPAPAAGQMQGQSLVLTGAAFNAPEGAPAQYFTVTRNALGGAQTLRVATLPDRGPPVPAETGVVVELDQAASALLSGKPLHVEVDYRPLPVNASSQLAVAALGSAPTQWISQPIPALAGSANFSLPPQQNVRGIGLRPLGSTEIAFGVEIVAIRITPQPGR